MPDYYAIDTYYKGWSEISSRLGVSETTAWRWEQDRGLPVHRINHRVVAYESEILPWLIAQEPYSASPALRKLLAAACDVCTVTNHPRIAGAIEDVLTELPRQ